MGKYVLGDFFTTIDGKWEVTDSPWSITPAMLEKYGNDDIPDKGCATCLFAKIVGGPATEVLFTTRDNGIKEVEPTKADGWAHYAGMHGSGSSYSPERGEMGWWNMLVVGSETEVGEGYGLPNNEHVSSYQVFNWVDDDEEIPTDPDPEIPVDPTLPGQPIVIVLAGVTILDGYFTPR